MAAVGGGGGFPCDTWGKEDFFSGAPAVARDDDEPKTESALTNPTAGQRAIIAGLKAQEALKKQAGQTGAEAGSPLSQRTVAGETGKAASTAQKASGPLDGTFKQLSIDSKAQNEAQSLRIAQLLRGLLQKWMGTGIEGIYSLEALDFNLQLLQDNLTLPSGYDVRKKFLENSNENETVNKILHCVNGCIDQVPEKLQAAIREIASTITVLDFGKWELPFRSSTHLCTLFSNLAAVSIEKSSDSAYSFQYLNKLRAFTIRTLFSQDYNGYNPIYIPKQITSLTINHGRLHCADDTYLWSEFCRLTSISSLALGESCIVEIDKELSPLPHIKQLRFSQLHDRFGSGVSWERIATVFPSLERLEIDGLLERRGQVLFWTSSTPQAIPGLKSLSFTRSNIDHAKLLEIIKLNPQIEEVNLNGSSFIQHNFKKIFSLFAPLKHLRKLHIKGMGIYLVDNTVQAIKKRYPELTEFSFDAPQRQQATLSRALDSEKVETEAEKALADLRALLPPQVRQRLI